MQACTIFLKKEIRYLFFPGGRPILSQITNPAACFRVFLVTPNFSCLLPIHVLSGQCVIRVVHFY